MGSSIYHVGWQQTYYNVPTEVRVRSDAYNECRRLALGRLLEEAQACRAGRRRRTEDRPGLARLGAGVVEFVAVGTAVRLPEAMRERGAQTVLSDLSGQEFTQCCEAGVRPVGIAAHTSVHYVPASAQTQLAQGSLWGSWANQELVDFSQGVYEAREKALGFVAAQVSELGGDGVIGVELSEHSRTHAVRRGMYRVARPRSDLPRDGHRDPRGPALAARPAPPEPLKILCRCAEPPSDEGTRPWPMTPPAPRAYPRRAPPAFEQNRSGLFTSDLSVNEFLLVRQAGFQPLGLVIGSSIYHIGYQQAQWKQSQEMNVLSQAMYEARELAMTRMEEEADQLGADGIVGVRLMIGRYDWGESMAEFIAMGTAVKHRGGVLHRAPSGRPFTSDLSGQEFWTLLQTGHRPVGMVMGSCVYHVAHQSWRQSLGTTGRNVELPNFTQALYDARELAMERMQAEALAAKAEGIVGVHIEEKSHGWGSHVIEFFAIGTAIIPSEGIEDHVIPAPQTVLDLS